MVQISIIIVNYNTHEYIRDCINSVIQYCSNVSYEIIVIDNNSTNKEIINIKNEFTNVKFIFLRENRGFGAGCNIGVNKAAGEYLLFLNPDIKIKNNSIKKLIDFYSANDKIGIVSGLLMDESEKLLYCYNYFPDLCWEFKEAYNIFLNKTINSLLNLSEIKKGIPFEVDWFHGACLLIKRDIFNEVKGFDENIFLYYEDVDLQLRIKKLGYKIFCIPESKFYHYERSSVREDDSFKIYHYYIHISKLYYYRKHGTQLQILFIRLFYITGSILKTLSLPLRPKKWKEIPARLQQYRIIICIYLSLMKKLDE